jgi:aryl-alcohol dehydrogenase-like predicted oxidoreductase
MGTGDLWCTIDAETSDRLMDYYNDIGGNFIDTAHIYSDLACSEKSIAEKSIGKWLKKKNIRNRYIIATKGAHPHLDSMHIQRLSPKEITLDLDESLGFLQTDYIDIYWLHRDDPLRPVEDILETLNRQVEKGKIRYFGCSNWRTERIIEAMDLAARNNINGFTGNQMHWNLCIANEGGIKDKALVAADKAMLDFHKNTNFLAVPYNSQASGFFSKIDENGVENLSAKLKNLYYNAENLKRMERVKKLSCELSRPVTHIILAYLMSQPFPTIPIVGCKSIKQLNDSLAANDLILSPESVQFLEEGA